MALYALPIVAQVIVPIVLLFWLYKATGGSGAAVLTRTVLAAAYLLAIAVAGLWLVVPWFVGVIYLLVFAVSMPFVIRRRRSLPWSPADWTGWFRLGVSAALAIGATVVAAHAIAGRWPPPVPMVDVDFPLRDGTFLVVNGGSNSLVSAHVQTLVGERYRDFRGQSYGVDIVAVNGLGLRASGIAPTDPRRYVIFGQPIHAPCSGTVHRAEDGHPDMAPPQADRTHLPGNFVLLDCLDVHILLAHIREGTVRVRPGDRLATGTIIGHVGNSGNTNEPHLHIHAQRPAQGDAFLSGEPLGIRLGGRFLVRNDRVTAPSR